MDELALTLVTDRTQTRGRDLVAVVGECLAAGLPWVQLREKDLGAGELAFIARRLRDLTRDTRAKLVINDRVDVALAVGADAVQRTSASLTVEDMRKVAGHRLRIGASAHSLQDALDAELQGADWVTFGPVWDTPSKRAYGPAQGLERLATVARGLKIPVVAIGGITPARAPEALAAGARGVAVISGILAAASPADATREYLRTARQTS
ncbi:MAG TPA: thiamine phosphate synthase [Methylomirabilota bacterium]|nr:thiamine phosphate synthase [Methylomirabilota bacterium]